MFSKFQYYITLIFKLFRKTTLEIKSKTDWLISCIFLYLQNAKFRGFKSRGIPYISVAIGGKLSIDTNFKMINGLTGNPVGRPQRCVFFVDKDAELIIGKNVGISCTALVAHKQIIIGDNVKIGAGVCIYDTDFHALDSDIRNNPADDMNSKLKLPVIIMNNVFIGAHSTILKGVKIGENSVIGACSVVTKSIPDNEIWAGNPAKLIRRIHE